MSKRGELQAAYTEAMNIIEPYCKEFNSGRSEIKELTEQCHEMEGFSDAIKNLYVNKFHAATPQVENNYLFGNFQGSFEKALEGLESERSMSAANATAYDLLMYKQEQQDRTLESINIDALQNANTIHKMMEDSIAIMNQDANPTAFADEISRCELMKAVIERNIDSDPNSYLNGTQISHSELTLYTIDLTMEKIPCHPDVDQVARMLESALNKDIEHAFNTGQKVPAEDIHVALDSCHHIDDDVKTAFSASLDAVIEREREETNASIGFE